MYYSTSMEMLSIDTKRPNLQVQYIVLTEFVQLGYHLLSLCIYSIYSVYNIGTEYIHHSGMPCHAMPCHDQNQSITPIPQPSHPPAKTTTQPQCKTSIQPPSTAPTSSLHYSDSTTHQRSPRSATSPLPRHDGSVSDSQAAQRRGSDLTRYRSTRWSIPPRGSRRSPRLGR